MTLFRWMNSLDLENLDRDTMSQLTLGQAVSTASPICLFMSRTVPSPYAAIRWAAYVLHVVQPLRWYIAAPPALSTCHPVICHSESFWSSNMSAASAKGAAVVVEEDVPGSGTMSMFVSLGASIFAKMVVGVFL